MCNSSFGYHFLYFPNDHFSNESAEITFRFSTGMQDVGRTLNSYLSVDLNESVTVWVTKQEPGGVNPVVRIKNRKIEKSNYVAKS